MKEFLFALMIVGMIAASSIHVYGYEGSSMDYTQGCMLVVGPGNISIGDIIVYNDERINTLIAHRVIGLCADGYVMKGDNNWGSEGCIPKSWVHGKVLGCY